MSFADLMADGSSHTSAANHPLASTLITPDGRHANLRLQLSNGDIHSPREA